MRGSACGGASCGESGRGEEEGAWPRAARLRGPGQAAGRAGGAAASGARRRRRRRRDPIARPIARPGRPAPRYLLKVTVTRGRRLSAAGQGRGPTGRPGWRRRGAERLSRCGGAQPGERHPRVPPLCDSARFRARVLAGRPGPACACAVPRAGPLSGPACSPRGGNPSRGRGRARGRGPQPRGRARSGSGAATGSPRPSGPAPPWAARGPRAGRAGLSQPPLPPDAPESRRCARVRGCWDLGPREQSLATRRAPLVCVPGRVDGIRPCHGPVLRQRQLAGGPGSSPSPAEKSSERWEFLHGEGRAGDGRAKDEGESASAVLPGRHCFILLLCALQRMWRKISSVSTRWVPGINSGHSWRFSPMSHTGKVYELWGRVHNAGPFGWVSGDGDWSVDETVFPTSLPKHGPQNQNCLIINFIPDAGQILSTHVLPWKGLGSSHSRERESKVGTRSVLQPPALTLPSQEDSCSRLSSLSSIQLKRKNH